MELSVLDEAAELVGKANANLDPALVTADDARKLLGAYAKVERLASYGRAVLAQRVDNAAEVARTTGTSIGKAKEAAETGAALADAPEVGDALSTGAISLDQAGEIAKAERARPGCSGELLGVAKDEAFHVLKDKARKVRLEVEQNRGLGDRQREARSARSYADDLGMVNVHLRLEPHVGTPIVNRAEAEADRLYRKAKKDGETEPFERMLADAYAAMLAGKGKGRTTRPELVVLVSHEVTKRGWTDVRDGEVCKIPGVGPVSPAVAKEIAQDAFLNGVFFDGTDLRHFRRWTRNPPVEVRTALELGEPPEFAGVRCVDCGNRFKTQNDHVEPHIALGPASTGNLKWRCWPCHQAKTARDRKAGKLTPRPEGPERGPP
jgi:HNH endonuclease